MLRQRTMRICRRAAYLLLKNSHKSCKVINNREFIARCYQIS